MADFEIPPPPPQKKPKSPLAVGCCSGCSAVAVLIVVAIFFAAKHGTKAVGESDKVARQYLQYVLSNDFKNAYALEATVWQRNSSPEQQKKELSNWKAEIGDIRTVELKGENFYSGTDGTRVDLRYLVHGTKSNHAVGLRLISEGNNMRVLAGNFSTTASP